MRVDKESTRMRSWGSPLAQAAHWPEVPIGAHVPRIERQAVALETSEYQLGTSDLSPFL
jgi:hypothetical protein